MARRPRITYTKELQSDIESMNKIGTIKTIRMDTHNGVRTLDDPTTDHFAVLISTNEEGI